MGARDFEAGSGGGALGPFARPRAVLLLSGGLDSATCLAIARDAGFAVHALTVAYGQRHAREVDQARAIARALGADEHRVLELDLRAIGGSSLTSDALPVEKDRPDLACAPGGPPRESGAIPSTYVPARNTILLSLGLAFAEVLGARDLFVGVNAVDYSGYPDCRPAFLEAFQRLAALATRAGVEGAPLRIHAPLLNLTKAEIIRRGLSLGVDYALTHSCYDPSPGGLACGRCDSCRLRHKGFVEAGVPDPTAYACPPGRTP